jgi:hypothetical protein
MSIDDDVPPPTPTPTPTPPPARRVPLRGWLLPLAILLPSMVLCGSVFSTSIKHPPGGVPADVCALIPTDLLNRVVPAAKVGDVDSKNSETYTNRARCSAQTDPDTARTTARGSLSVELDRHGTLAGKDPREHAQDEFGSSKRFALSDTIVPHRVFDLERLGDAAFVAVDRQRDTDRQEHQSVVEVEVLAADRTLRLHYVASPTTDDLAVSAAVAVARALLGRLR